MDSRDVEVPVEGASEMQARESGANESGRKSRVRFTEAIWAEAEAAYFDGATAKEVSARFGMSEQTIYLRVEGRGKKRVARDLKLSADITMACHPGRSEAEGRDPFIGLDKERHGPRTALRASGVTPFGGGEGGLIHLLARLFAEVGRQLLAAGAVRVERQVMRDGRIRVRRHHSEEIWKAAKRDFEEGDFTAPAIAERYGMTTHAVKRRARVEKWSKTVTEAPLPLLPPPDPAQVDEAGGVMVSAWARVAHAAQRAPEGAWSTWLFQGGRGAGKTRAGAEWLASRAETTPNGRFALVGPTQHDVREVMIEGPSGLRSLPGREIPQYESSRRKLKWKNGAVAYAFSAEEPERLRGPQFEAAWADEFCVWPKPDATLSNLRLGLRLGGDPRLVVTTTPKPVASLRRLKAEVSCVVTQAATGANAAHLTPGFLSGLEALYGGTRLAEQELMGVLLDGAGALWRAEELARVRGARPEKLERVVVAVDPPAGTISGEPGSACGIIVAGRSGERAYVLADLSAEGLSPLGWARRAADAARTFGARRIVAEANQGGDMVRTTLASAGAGCAVELVRARHGKRARAEPVAALYEQGRVTHCGAFVQLEEEMLALGESEEAKKLDRADALVWALTSLMVDRQAPPPRVWPSWE